MDHEDRTLTERVAKLEAIVLDRGEPMQDEGDVRVVSREEAQKAWNLRGSIAAERVHEPTALEEIINRIQAATGRVHNSAGKLEEIGERIMGSLPQGEGCGGDESKIDGTLDHTFRTLNGLDVALSRLEAAALRLERI
jgi:hypothetical protein